MQTKSTTMFQLIPVRMVTIKKQNKTKQIKILNSGEDVMEKVLYSSVGENTQPLWKTA